MRYESLRLSTTANSPAPISRSAHPRNTSSCPATSENTATVVGASRASVRYPVAQGANAGRRVCANSVDVLVLLVTRARDRRWRGTCPVFGAVPVVAGLSLGQDRRHGEEGEDDGRNELHGVCRSLCTGLGKEVESEMPNGGNRSLYTRRWWAKLGVTTSHIWIGITCSPGFARVTC